MKHHLRKVITIILIASILMSCFSIAASASDYDYDSCLQHYFTKLNDNIPKNLQGSCGYVAMSMLLGYYDMYWNDDFVAQEYETTVPYKTDLNNLDAPALKTENEDWNRYYNDYLRDVGYISMDDFVLEYYSSFVEEKEGEGYLHIDLINMGIDEGYYTFGLPFDSYMSVPLQSANILDLYLDNVFGEARYFDPLGLNSLNNENPPISVNLITSYSTPGYNYDDVLNKMGELLENNIPVIYTAVDVDQNQLLAHSMVAYDTVKDSSGNITDYKFHTGWIDTTTSSDDTTYTTFNDTNLNSLISILWIEIENEETIPHKCCDKYTTIYGYNVCSCDTYEIQHPKHTHKALYDVPMCSAADLSSHCICGTYVKGKHNFVAHYNDSTHYYECACGERTSNEAHNITYTNHSEFYHSGYCDCGYSFENKLHLFENCVPVTGNSSRHSGVCDCGYVGIEAHSWVSYSFKYHKCSKCGLTREHGSNFIEPICSTEPGTETD